MRRSRRSVRNATPPAPVVIQAPKPDVEGLKHAYDWFTVSRATAIKLAVKWYADNTTKLLIGNPLTENQQKSYDRAQKSANISQSDNTTAPERETAGVTAIKKYESIWAVKHSLPTFESIEANPPQANGIIANCDTVLANLNAIGTPFGMKYSLYLGIGDSREFAAGSINVPASELVGMQAQAPLQVALAEVPTIAKVLSIVKDADGIEQFDGEAFMGNLDKVLAGVYTWASSSDRITRPLGKPLPTTAGSAPKAPRVSNGSSTPRPPRVSTNSASRITVIDLALVRMSGKRMEAIRTLETGMTVAMFKAALVAKNLGGYAGWALATAVAKGAVTVA